jgi:hypothetical protein
VNVKPGRNMTMQALILVSALLIAGHAAAEPVDLAVIDAYGEGGVLKSSQTYTPAIPFEGEGNIDFENGTGTLTLPPYSIDIDLSIDGTVEARLDIDGWKQMITSIDEFGNVESDGSGTLQCTNLGGLGSAVCGAVDPNIGGWPPEDGVQNEEVVESSAVYDSEEGTITIIDNSQITLGGTNYLIFAVPEPSTAALSLASLFAILALRRARNLHPAG